LNITFLKYLNYQQLSKAVGNVIVSRIERCDLCLIGLSTGFSPKMAYLQIAKHLVQKPVLAPKIRGFQIDEWKGLSGKNPGSCKDYLYKNVIRPWGLNPDQCFLIDGQHPDQEQQITAMRSSLSKRPIDICILGLGKNGHLALNEPGSSLDSTCRIVKLHETSVSHPMLSNAKADVQKGITIGLQEIMESKEILLLVTGEGKKEAYQKLITRTPIEEFPASAIFGHDKVTIFVDEAAVN